MNRRADQYRPLFAQLGERVKGHRKALGLSLEEVGQRRRAVPGNERGGSALTLTCPGNGD